MAVSRTATPDDVSPTHLMHMNVACETARNGCMRGLGGPFGCAIVKDDVIIAVAHNTVLKDKMSTRHAEMNAIRHACQFLRTTNLSGCSLYTTCEPCPMCWGGIYWSHISEVYIGIDEETAAQFGWDDSKFHKEVVSSPRGSTINKKTIKDADIVTRVKEIFLPLKNGSPVEKCSCVYITQRMKDPKVESKGHLLDVVNMATTSGSNFNAILVDQNGVIGRGSDQREKNLDCTATAEIMAIESACRYKEDYNLNGCTIYCSAEPDVMSLGAILWSRIDNVVVGADWNTLVEAGESDAISTFCKKIGNLEGPRVERNIQFDRCKWVFSDYAKSQGDMY